MLNAIAYLLALELVAIYFGLVIMIDPDSPTFVRVRYLTIGIDSIMWNCRGPP